MHFFSLAKLPNLLNKSFNIPFVCSYELKSMQMVFEYKVKGKFMGFRVGSYGIFLLYDFVWEAQYILYATSNMGMVKETKSYHSIFSLYIYIHLWIFSFRFWIPEIGLLPFHLYITQQFWTAWDYWGSVSFFRKLHVGQKHVSDENVFPKEKPV